MLALKQLMWLGILRGDRENMALLDLFVPPKKGVGRWLHLGIEN